MSSEPIELRLATDAGRRVFDRVVAGMIRAGQFAAAETLLMESLGDSRTNIADAARASTADAVRISGWERVHATCARQLAAKISIGAIGLNLSNYNDSTTSVWHDKEPAIEFAVYGNDVFDFSSATVEEILRASAEPPTPWQGQMTGPEPPVVPSIFGLRSLNSALLEYANDAPWRPSVSVNADGEAAPDEYVTFAVGEWMLHLRFHQAISRDIRQLGFPSLVPVLIGAHDVGPFLVSVVMPERISDPPPASETDGPQPALTSDKAVDPITEGFLDELDKMRRTIQSLGFFSRGRRRALIEQSEARESELLQSVGLVWPRRTWEMSDSQFTSFAYTFRIAREVAREPPTREK